MTPHNLHPLTEWRTSNDSFSKLEGKVALLTGAADGIGRALTLALSEQGTTVLMLDKKSRHLEKLYDSICEQGFTEPVILPVDLLELDAHSATMLAQGVADDFGKLDFLIHNAAELGSPSPMDHYDMDYWSQVMQVNLQSPYLLTRALLPLLRHEGPSQVLFTSAAVGRTPKAFGGAYSIAYAGIEAQSIIWSEELEKVSNIKVNTIDPGPVRTVMRRRSHPGEDQSSLASPQEIMPAYLQLLADETPLSGRAFTIM